MPWFVLGFVAMVLLNSVVHIPPSVHAPLAILTTLLLSMALAAMGLNTNLGALKARGLKPFALAGSAWLFISLFSLALVLLLAR